MDRALKFAITISAIIILIYFALAMIAGIRDWEFICVLGIGFVVLTLFFWIVYALTRALWRTERKIWRWMNEEERK